MYLLVMSEFKEQCKHECIFILTSDLVQNVWLLIISAGVTPLTRVQQGVTVGWLHDSCEYGSITPTVVFRIAPDVSARVWLN